MMKFLIGILFVIYILGARFVWMQTPSVQASAPDAMLVAAFFLLSFLCVVSMVIGILVAE